MAQQGLSQKANLGIREDKWFFKQHAKSNYFFWRFLLMAWLKYAVKVSAQLVWRAHPDVEAAHAF